MRCSRSFSHALCLAAETLTQSFQLLSKTKLLLIFVVYLFKIRFSSREIVRTGNRPRIAASPSASSMRNASFHLAVRSERAHEPTFN